MSSQHLLWSHTGLQNYIAGEVVEESVQRTLTSSLIRTKGHIPKLSGQDTQLSKINNRFLTQTVTEAITTIPHQAHQQRIRLK